MPHNVFAQLARHAADRPDAAAVVCVGGGAAGLTWTQLHHRTRAASAWVRANVPQNAVVALASRNRPRMVPVFLGVLHAGRTLFPVDAALTDAEVNALVERAGIDRVLADASTAARLTGNVTSLDAVLAGAGPVDEAFPGAALLLQSSGTTGGPKIVRRSGASLDAVARNVAQAVGLTPADRVIAAVPLTHSYGLENALLAPVFAGASMLHHVGDDDNGPRRFVPGTVLGAGATVLPGVPSMFEMILAGPAGCGSLRCAYSAGAPLPAALADALRERDGLALGTLYGATEIGSVTFAATRSGDGAVGRPMDGVDVRVVDPERPEHDVEPGGTGHLAVRAPSMFDGYLNADGPDADRLPTGHFLTGDLGRTDPDTGEVVVTGRLKLLIDIGGRKVNPLEVESAVADHPGIAECVVLPDPVSPTISRVKAVVTAASGHAAPDARELRRFLKPHLAAYKLPRSVEVRATLPKSATGKILRRELLPALPTESAK